MQDQYTTVYHASQPRLTRHRADPKWAEGVQLAMGAQVGYCRHRHGYLRSYFVPKNPKRGPSTNTTGQDERRYTIWSPIIWLYEAPGVMRTVQRRLGWPTPNHLMTHYYSRYPHTAWWAKADRITQTRARTYNIKYMLSCLAGIAARALARARELLQQGNTEEIINIPDFVVQEALRLLDACNWERAGYRGRSGRRGWMSPSPLS